MRFWDWVVTHFSVILHITWRKTAPRHIWLSACPSCHSYGCWMPPSLWMPFWTLGPSSEPVMFSFMRQLCHRAI